MHNAFNSQFLSKWFLFWFSFTFWIFDIQTIIKFLSSLTFFVFSFALSSSFCYVITRNTVDLKRKKILKSQLSRCFQILPVCHIEIVHKLIQMRRCTSSIPVLVFYFVLFKHKRNPFARQVKESESEWMCVCVWARKSRQIKLNNTKHINIENRR